MLQKITLFLLLTLPTSLIGMLQEDYDHDAYENSVQVKSINSSSSHFKILGCNRYARPICLIATGGGILAFSLLDIIVQCVHLYDCPDPWGIGGGVFSLGVIVYGAHSWWNVRKDLGERKALIGRRAEV